MGGGRALAVEVYCKDPHTGQLQRRDWVWLIETFGSGLHLLSALDVVKFELFKIEVTTEAASLNAHVYDAQGAPLLRQEVAHTWPGIELGGDVRQLRSGSTLLRPYRSVYADRAAIKCCEADGKAGFGMGTSSYIRDPLAGGPNTLWVLSEAFASDALAGIGMIGGTNHLAPTHLHFRINGQAGLLRQALLDAGERYQAIQFNPAAALQRAIFADEFVPNSGDFALLHEGLTYVAQRAEHLRTGAVRVYYCRQGEWGTVKYVER